MALAVCGYAALPPAAQDYQPNAAVGDVPNPWNPNVDAYQLMDVLRLSYSTTTTTLESMQVILSML